MKLRFLFIVCISAITACAPHNYVQNPKLKLPGEIDPSGCEPPGNPSCQISAASLSQDSSEFTCPSGLNDNVTDTSGFDYSGAHEYRVCYAKNNPHHFEITAHTAGLSPSSSFCAFPMSSAPGVKLMLITEPLCFVPARDGTAEVFFVTSSDINYMIIVEYKDAPAMAKCLNAASQCPQFSEGFVH